MRGFGRPYLFIRQCPTNLVAEEDMLVITLTKTVSADTLLWNVDTIHTYSDLWRY